MIKAVILDVLKSMKDYPCITGNELIGVMLILLGHEGLGTGIMISPLISILLIALLALYEIWTGRNAEEPYTKKVDN